MSKSASRALAFGTVMAAMAGTAAAQVSILVTDRTGNKVWMATDASRDGVIDNTNAVELHTYFDGTNAAGLVNPANPNSIGFGNGMALIGDQDATTGRRWTWARDLNGDGDALDEGEAGLWCDVNSESGFSFAFPTGVAFGLDGQIAMVNAGNGFGADDVFLAHDGNNDNDAEDAGEVMRFVTVNGFGTNGLFSPQEITFDHSGTLFLHNSSSQTGNNLHGVYRLRDTSGDGTVDQATEMSVFFGVGNAAGILPSAGFDLCLDPMHARSFYYWQIATGGIDQLLHITDFNGDGDAMDEGEAVIAYQTSESGFTSIDSIALGDGSVLISDNSGWKVYRLTDTDGDGRFVSPGERQPFISAGLSSARAMSLVHDVGCSPADMGRQGGILGGDGLLDNNDFIVFIDLFFAEAPLADVGRQGGVGPGDGAFDNNDFIVFIDVFFAGCP